MRSSPSSVFPLLIFQQQNQNITYLKSFNHRHAKSYFFALSGPDPEKDSQVCINTIFRIQGKGMLQLK